MFDVEQQRGFENIDHFNLLPIAYLSGNEFGIGASKKTTMGLASRDPMRLIKNILCSQCGRTAKRSLDINHEHSSSGVGHFCSEHCTRLFKHNDFKLVDRHLYDRICSHLTANPNTREVADELQVSPAVVISIRTIESSRRVAPRITPIVY